MSRFAPKLIPEDQARAIVQSKVDWILSVCMPRKIFVFGSAARSEMTDHSDVDLALIFDDESELRAARNVVFSKRPDDLWPQDLLLFTVQEFDRKKSVGGVCFLIATEGICLFERNES
jgi:predicted nucleotidyltransferase